MYNFQLEISCTGKEVVHYLERYPLLPGAILLEQGNYVGMVSRIQLLEFLSRPYGQELFIHKPLEIIYSYVRTTILQMRDTTTILTAMRLNLRRPHELLAEPIVVQTESDTYRLLDVQVLNMAAWQILEIETQVRYERSQVKMIQNDKMANLGRLVDGVVHEILDPVGFIWGNLTFVSTYSQNLLKLIAAYDREIPQHSEEIIHLKEEIEFDYLEQDLSQTLKSIRNGAERLKNLVASLQNFCYIDEVYAKPADLHTCIDSIILLINSRIKGEIKIIKKYGHLPPVYCFIGQLSQVLMNIFSRAVDTLLDAAVRQKFHPESVPRNYQPQIDITTEVISEQTTNTEQLDSRWAAIRIADNGPGISPELLQQIIESFSLEKLADKETNLAISYQIVTAKHGGKLNIRSQLGSGTEFEILLPLV